MPCGAFSYQYPGFSTIYPMHHIGSTILFAYIPKILSSYSYFLQKRNTNVKYKPPFTITPVILRLVSEISELVGHVQALSGSTSPLLRRENRIRTIHASLAIENNTLTLEQVTAVLSGTHIFGQHIEIQ